MPKNELKTLKDLENTWNIRKSKIGSLDVCSYELREMAKEYIKAIENQELIFGGLMSTSFNKQQLEIIRKKVEQGTVKLIKTMFNLEDEHIDDRKGCSIDRI